MIHDSINIMRAWNKIKPVTYKTIGQWIAYDEEWDIGSPTGYGDTREEAIEDLKEKYEYRR